MRESLHFIVIFAFLSFTIQVQAEEKLIFSVEEIRSLSYSELDKIWDEQDTKNLRGKGVFDSLANKYLVSIGENLEIRSAKHQAAKETVDKYTEIDKRKRLEPIWINRKWIRDGDISTDVIDSVWHMKPVRIDTDENIKRGFFKRKYLIFKSEMLIDSIVVHFATGVALPGFVPKKTFVINGKPVISYNGGGEIEDDRLWIDGIDINEYYNVTSAIMPCYYNKKLFFVFKKDGKCGWCYDGEMHPDVWDVVSHFYGGQGEHIPEIERPNAFTGFTAIRDGIMYTCKVVIKAISE
ncbi:MAG: hypothetical protein P9X24_05840 [Candidatus Hatepunaea meridiana]|nr:hypothetical protein [Candidatus Hatepunaea meridiana]